MQRDQTTCACLCECWAYFKIHARACNLNISRGTNEIPSAWLQMRLRLRARVLKIRASSHQRLPSPLSRFVIPHGAEPKGWSQKKGQPGRQGLFSPKKNTHTHAHAETHHANQVAKVAGPSALFAASCVRATFLPVIHMVQVPPPPPGGISRQSLGFLLFGGRCFASRVCAPPRGRF